MCDSAPPLARICEMACLLVKYAQRLSVAVLRNMDMCSSRLVLRVTQWHAARHGNAYSGALFRWTNSLFGCFTLTDELPLMHGTKRVAAPQRWRTNPLRVPFVPNSAFASRYRREKATHHEHRM